MPEIARTTPYPETRRERDEWILERRGPRNLLDPRKPHAFFTEEERTENGEIVSVATLFLSNRECPWRCLMCDLWLDTLEETVPAGAIPAQIDEALSQLPPARRIKLYNSGSFFDSKAIPCEDYEAIAQRLRSFERVVVESHPALIGESCERFRDLLSGDLEIAMGLETAHPEVLSRLNKQMSLDQFSAAAEKLRRLGVALRVFILVQPPFLKEEEAIFWAERSLDFAFDCGATAASLIPTRAGNGALEALRERGDFSLPKLAALEAAMVYGLGLNRGRVFADLWNLERFASCSSCFPGRFARLHEMNLRQIVSAPIACSNCGAKS